MKEIRTEINENLCLNRLNYLGIYLTIEANTDTSNYRGATFICRIKLILHQHLKNRATCSVRKDETVKATCNF